MADDKDDIERYKKGSLSSAERHALEKKALNDPFLNEALEGIEFVSADAFSADLNELAKKIERKQTIVWFTPLRIAAGVIMMIGVGSLFYFLNPIEPITMAMEKSGAVVTDTIKASGKDSVAKNSPTLLSLADEKKSEKDKGSVKSSPTIIKKLNPSVADKNVAASSAKPETESKPVITSSEEQGKPKAGEDEMSEVVVQAAPALATQGAGAEMRKETVARAKMSDLKKSGVADQLTQNIVGQVTSAEDGSALAGVNVVVKGTNEGTVTDADGNYLLNTQATNPQLVFSFIGMHSAEAKPNGSQQNIQLKEDVSQLSDVVVTGQRNSDPNTLLEPVIKMAAPEGGLRAYNKYLESNLRYPEQAIENKIKGKVTISFTVGLDGSLNGFTVLKGLGHGCDDEVIRLIKEGPHWSPTTQDDVAVESEVKVKLKFDPDMAKK